MGMVEITQCPMSYLLLLLIMLFPSYPCLCVCQCSCVRDVVHTFVKHEVIYGVYTLCMYQGWV